MSGHSKWATTKRAKAVTDAKRATVFARYANTISIAAREKGGDQETNFSLRLAVEKARAVNMPKDNIERAIKRGLGELVGERLEEILYEGFGPGGVALLIETITNNRNRTVSDIKHLLSKYGGNLGSANSVAWMFEQKGVITLGTPALSSDDELALIEAGVQDSVVRDGQTLLLTPTETLLAMKKVIEQRALPLIEAEYVLFPKNTITLNDPVNWEKNEKLLDELDELSDVSRVTSNISWDDTH